MRSVRELAAQITELSGHLNAANYRLLTLIAEFDRREGWSDGATQSCAHWLNWQCGIELGAARERVRVAHALEKLVRAYRRAKDAEELSCEAQQQATCGVSYFHDPDGSLVLKARLPAEVGALVIKALDAAINDRAANEGAVAAEGVRYESWACGIEVGAPTERPSWGARRADALGRIAESFLQHGSEALMAGDRHQIVVHVDADTLQDSVAGRCELEEGPALAAETARPLSRWGQLYARHQEAGLHITANTATTRWRGESMDYGIAVEVLLGQARRARNVSAESR